MISIPKPAAAEPAELRRIRADKLNQLRTLRAQRNLKSKDIAGYGEASIKTALRNLQHGKCCYCERFTEDYANAVEHFRPKTSVKQALGESDIEGYWWLAFDFGNLYFICHECNTKKGNLFPIADGGIRLIPEENPIERDEQALLLDPGRDPIGEHLAVVWSPLHGAFRIVARDGSSRGQQTLNCILDRDGLHELQGRYLRDRVMPVLKRYTRAPDHTAERRRAVAEAIRLAQPNAQFSFLARAVFGMYGVELSSEPD